MPTLRSRKQRTPSEANKQALLSSWLQTSTAQVPSPNPTSSPLTPITPAREAASASDCNYESSIIDDLDLSDGQIESLVQKRTSRLFSIDSRIEPGNEDYERDGFVVDDDEELEFEDDVDSVGSEITLAPVISPKRVTRRTLIRKMRKAEEFSSEEDEDDEEVFFPVPDRKLTGRKRQRVVIEDSTDDEEGDQNISKRRKVSFAQVPRKSRMPFDQSSSSGTSRNSSIAGIPLAGLVQRRTKSLSAIGNRVVQRRTKSLPTIPSRRNSSSDSSKLFYTDSESGLLRRLSTAAIPSKLFNTGVEDGLLRRLSVAAVQSTRAASQSISDFVSTYL